jgi:hypothetical protein
MTNIVCGFSITNANANIRRFKEEDFEKSQVEGAEKRVYCIEIQEVLSGWSLPSI